MLTEKVAEPPLHIVWFTGCEDMQFAQYTLPMTDKKRKKTRPYFNLEMRIL